MIPGGGHFEFLRVPFGLMNAVPTFHRIVLAVLNVLLPLKCLVYLDDVLVVGRTFDQLLNNGIFGRVEDRPRSAGELRDFRRVLEIQKRYENLVLFLVGSSKAL